MVQGGHDDGLPHCDAHRERAAAWFCTLCKAPKCDECVNHTGMYAGENAACKLCGGRAVALPTMRGAREEGMRGAGVIDPREQRWEWIRDVVGPPVVLNVLCWVQFLFTWSRHDTGAGLTAVLVWTVGPAAALGATAWMLNSWLDIYYGAIGPCAAKLGVLGLGMHLLQMLLLSGYSFAFAGDLTDQTLVQALSVLFPMIFAVLMLPAGLFYLAAEYLFELSPVEAVATATSFFVMYTVAMLVLSLGGAPL
ncbi:MAG: hypothetical protein GC162_01080 [Planctomycetes bacterium]|nr:hypothetical protein [Planctomycetota bacterium]